jgi:cellulose biosynthesis protein BcsQ
VSRIIFTNQKGGVGKTTLTREVGITLSELGMRVLW